MGDRLSRFCCWRPTGLDDSGDKQPARSICSAPTEGRLPGGTKRIHGRNGIRGTRRASATRPVSFGRSATGTAGCRQRWIVKNSPVGRRSCRSALRWRRAANRAARRAGPIVNRRRRDRVQRQQPRPSLAGSYRRSSRPGFAPSRPPPATIGSPQPAVSGEQTGGPALTAETPGDPISAWPGAVSRLPAARSR